MTLTVELPDDAKDVMTVISNLIKEAGGSVSVENDDDLTQEEFELLQESFREVLQIKKGLIKPIPASELWND
ncbi:hypothetical protein [Mucilaginibacter myungsuensis]|uniref:Uncharacterized protein n=1 Tax=Mucilaginibacter myungsuensis TaxID=649104 RepID=A0A929KY63_9SPHI|nr:hypothetical protein [Mucilaginibacter myungsuensis]MBE9663834.1 hypothetical protein [Mucilaginibacter myungsuensis]MDN3598451.1 hypothetical protein [Mucilaginibacter myungsuensis]